MKNLLLIIFIPFSLSLCGMNGQLRLAQLKKEGKLHLINTHSYTKWPSTIKLRQVLGKKNTVHQRTTPTLTVPPYKHGRTE